MDKQSGEPGSRILYAAAFHYGVYKSTNSGETWIEINNGLGTDKEYAWEIINDPSDAEILYLGLNSRGAGLIGLYKSTNAGENWEVLPNFPAGDVLSIDVNSNGIYAGVTDNFNWNYTGGLYHSSDRGDSWMKILDHSRIADITSMPGDDNTLLAAGQQWYRIGEDIPALFLSTDGGNNWNDISTGLNHTFINSARFNKHNTNEIFVCTAGGGLWKYKIFISSVKSTLLPSRFFVSQNYPILLTLLQL
ncbi:MAG: hypothetical protein U5K00_07150 [Melioribacteraceae bacterium]|nr:hypothetical protein [Melioribacteraceae bacterium]